MKLYEKILCALVLSLFIGTMVYFIVGLAERKPSVIVKQDKEYLYVKKYELYNRDSAVYKYHQPIEYKGVVTYRRRSGGYVGVPGKGGHPVTHYRIKIWYNGSEHCLTGVSYYNRFNEGDSVKITQSFWPEGITYKNMSRQP